MNLTLIDNGRSVCAIGSKHDICCITAATANGGYAVMIGNHMAMAPDMTIACGANRELMTVVLAVVICLCRTVDNMHDDDFADGLEALPDPVEYGHDTERLVNDLSYAFAAEISEEDIHMAEALARHVEEHDPLQEDPAETHHPVVGKSVCLFRPVTHGISIAEAIQHLVTMAGLMEEMVTKSNLKLGTK